jgi:pimeloyl-ACP methyl ester carboxylesterase
MHRLPFIMARCIVCVLAALVLPFSLVAQRPSSTEAPAFSGMLVDAGGHLIHINCAGSGGPTVVMEAGAGDFSFDWGLVQAKAAKYARSCSYDRAGYAWSEPGPTPRTLQQIAVELHTVLHKASINEPYILVGHSLGGLIVRTFASQYPKETAGMVLVDSSHEDMLISLTDRTTKQENVVRFRELSRGREIPATQKTMLNAGNSSSDQQGQSSSSPQTKLDAPFNKLPPNLQQTRLWAMSQSNYSAARSSEFDFLPEEMSRIFSNRSKIKHPLGDIPLIVLTRKIGEHSGADQSIRRQLDESHERLQADLVTLSTNSKRMIAEHSGHHIHLDEPELVSDAISQVITAARQRTSLVKK